MEKETPLISIIVPIHDSEKYIQKCVESIIKQTYTNFELIVIDDHSTDNTLKICKMFENDDRVNIVINNTKKGVSHTRNIGIEKSNGKYIAFIDSDDIISEDYIEVLYNLSIQYPDYLAMCGFVRFHHDELDFDGSEVLEKNIFTSNKLLANIFYYHPAAWGCLFRSDLIKTHNICMEETASFNEDIYFTCKYLCLCSGGICIPNRLYGYRYNEEGIGANKKHTELTHEDVEHRSKGYYAFQNAIAFAKKNAPDKMKSIDYGYSFIAAEVMLTAARAGTKDFQLKRNIIKYLKPKYCIHFIVKGDSLSQKLLVLCVSISPRICKFVLDDLSLIRLHSS